MALKHRPKSIATTVLRRTGCTPWRAWVLAICREEPANGTIADRLAGSHRAPKMRCAPCRQHRMPVDDGVMYTCPAPLAAQSFSFTICLQLCLVNAHKAEVRY